MSGGRGGYTFSILFLTTAPLPPPCNFLLTTPEKKTYVLEDRRQGTLREEITTTLQQSGCDSGSGQHVCFGLYSFNFTTKSARKGGGTLRDFNISHGKNLTTTTRGRLKNRVFSSLFHVCAKRRSKNE